MTIRNLVAFCCLAPALSGQTPCLTVDGAEIRGKDLIRALPAFAGIAPESSLAQAPLPGGTRTFSSSELQSLGVRFSVHLESPHEVCFQIATEPLNRDRVAEVMRQALQVPAGNAVDMHLTNVRVAIVETSPGPVPVGSMEFTRSNLGTPGSPDQRAPILWRGDVLYGGNRRFAIWAKVRITAPIPRVVAVENLRTGVAIEAGQIRTEVSDGFPVVTRLALSVDQVIGLVPLRSIAAGDEVRADNVKQPNVINRGDVVRVEVRIGAARLALNGLAESAGHLGDMIPVRNPDSSRTFRARVEGKGSVVVERLAAGEN